MAIPFEKTAKNLLFTVQDYSLFAWEALANLFRPPVYWPEFLMQSDIIGVGSVTIVILSGFFTGGVLALQSAATLAQFGATAVTGRFVSTTMIRELGPVLTGIMVSGRNASSMASELGSMVVTEQVDAMRALGVDPMRRLVTPRLFASITMLVFLTIIADAFGILGGAFVTSGRVPLRPGVPGRHRHAAADDRVGAERPGLQPLQMHGASTPGAVPLGEAEDLGQGASQHLAHLRGGELAEVERPLGHVGERLGQELVMAAVRAVDRVGRPQRDDRADRAPLLSDGGVRGPVHQALAGQLEDGLLEGADEVELAEHGGEQRGVGRLPVRRRAGQAGPLGARREALDAWHGRHATQRMHTFQQEVRSVRPKGL